MKQRANNCWYQTNLFIRIQCRRLKYFFLFLILSLPFFHSIKLSILHEKINTPQKEHFFLFIWFVVAMETVPLCLSMHMVLWTVSVNWMTGSTFTDPSFSDKHSLETNDHLPFRSTSRHLDLLRLGFSFVLKCRKKKMRSILFVCTYLIKEKISLISIGLK